MHGKTNHTKRRYYYCQPRERAVHDRPNQRFQGIDDGPTNSSGADDQPDKHSSVTCPRQGVPLAGHVRSCGSRRPAAAHAG